MYTIYGTKNCSYCDRAKDLLYLKGFEFKYIDIEEDEDGYNLFQKNRWKTVPQIYKGDTHIGGYVELTGEVNRPQ